MYEMYENVLYLGKLSDFTRFDILGHLGMIPLTHDAIIYLHLCLRNYTAALHLHTVTHILLLRSARLKCPHYLLLAVQPFRHHPVLLLEGLENLCDFLRNTRGQRNSNPFLPGFLLGVAKNGHII